jgi:hypothetical protein
MNKLYLKKIVTLILLIFLIEGAGNAQIFHKDPEKKLFGKTHLKSKGPKVKESRFVLKAKRKQEANDRKLKKDYEKSVKQSQKRTVDIQTPEVQARMKQNKKEYTVRDRGKRKKIKADKSGAAKKYN